MSGKNITILNLHINKGILKKKFTILSIQKKKKNQL